MSCITENTIIIRPEAESTLLNDIELVKEKHMISGVKRVLLNDRYAVYIFDCNGDQPWEVEEQGTLALDLCGDVIAMETCYSEDELWTRTFNPESNCLEDTDEALADYMEAKLTPEEYEQFCEDTEYTYC